MREAQVADMGGLQGAGLGPAVPPLTGAGAGRLVRQALVAELAVRAIALDESV